MDGTLRSALSLTALFCFSPPIAAADFYVMLPFLLANLLLPLFFGAVRARSAKKRKDCCRQGPPANIYCQAELGVLQDLREMGQHDITILFILD